MARAMQAARDGHAQVLDLTSNPARIQANALYLRLGFQQWQTNVYRLELDPPPGHASTPV
jgi:hypothetical protein